MGKKLSAKLSPRAKKMSLEEGAAVTVRCQAEVAPGLAKSTFESELDALGGTLRSWDGESRLTTFEIPSDRLVELAEVEGIVYVDVARFLSADRSVD